MRISANDNNNPKSFMTYEGMLSNVCAQNAEYLARKIRNAESINLEATNEILKAIEVFNETLVRISEENGIQLNRALPKNIKSLQ